MVILRIQEKKLDLNNLSEGNQQHAHHRLCHLNCQVADCVVHLVLRKVVCYPQLCYFC